METGKDPKSEATPRPTLSSGELARGSALWPSATRVSQAIKGTQQWLVNHQQPDGSWCAELQGDTILESETILLLAWLDELEGEFPRSLSRYLLQEQQPNGGWSLYPGGQIDVSVTVKAYFALKLMGHSAHEPRMVLAREQILRLGGADAVNSFTRFFLALLGQIPYAVCPAVPPEAILLPKVLPVNIYRVSAWSRTILVPLSVVWAHRPCRTIPESHGIRELMLSPPAAWPPTHAPEMSPASKTEQAWKNLFLAIDRGLKILDSWRIRPLRRLALQRAERWMLDRFEESDGLGAIYPPIVWSWIALRCQGYDRDAAPVEECRRQLMGLVIREGSTARIQPCKSPIWDTAITLRALGRVNSDAHVINARIASARERAITWLLSKEVRQRGDWSETVRAEPAGWFFEYNNRFYPDTDDTSMVLLALRDEVILAGHPDRDLIAHPQWMMGGRTGDRLTARRLIDSMDQLSTACQRGRQWLLAMQNRDGGWGAFDRNNDTQFLCHVPFADHNAMIDPSTPDLTGRVIESLAAWGVGRRERPMERAIAYLRRTQETDGSWFGRWGVNYIYGTWQVLYGLHAAGIPADDPAMQRGAEWLFRYQQPEGGWGESADSYADPSLRGQGPLTPSQTAWAVLGLMAAGHARSAAVIQGIQYLLNTQQPDGSWTEIPFTGTGFPQVFYLRYHYYRIYFPLLALRTWRYMVGSPS